MLFIDQGESLLMAAVHRGREEKMPRDVSRLARVESSRIPSTMSEGFSVNSLDRAINVLCY